MKDLTALTSKIRKAVVKMAHASYASHTGSALSAIDILAVLYFRIMNIDPLNPKDQARDRFILSKGHASAALYATLAAKGFFPEEYLDKYYCDNGMLPGHIDMTAVPGLEASAGSLGHGLSIGMGIALAARKDKLKSNVYVLAGDGELNEGSMWEAIMLAPQLKLNNIRLIIDHNKLQGYGRSSDIIDLEPLAAKFDTFGWEVLEVDGHSYSSLEKAFKFESAKPLVIIADTIKGKGVSYMEDNFLWHYKSPNDDELTQAMEELSK